MKIEVTVPDVGESITGGFLGSWLKQEGDYVTEGDQLFEYESDKATLNVPANASGILHIIIEENSEILKDQVVATIKTDAKKPDGIKEESSETTTEEETQPLLSPAVRRIIQEGSLDPATIAGTGKDGRITKEDALKALESKNTPPDKSANTRHPPGEEKQTRGSRRVKMTRLRKRIAENLVASKQNSAHLTTFNEIDMTEVMTIRTLYKEEFSKTHNVRLGFMSFFIKAAWKVLAVYPEVNAFIDGEDIVYNDYYDIGIALSTDRGLLIPVLRNADTKSFAQIETEIISFSKRAKEKTLLPHELSGATFTITNGGVFGSLLSTPIPSPPQTGILGMHAIQKRPVVIDNEIKIRPMMYVALTYDHRIIDGREAIGFLVHIKKLVEDPRRLFLDI